MVEGQYLGLHICFNSENNSDDPLTSRRTDGVKKKVAGAGNDQVET